MGSPITLSGFNNIDFSQVLNALMAQERQPVTLLEKQKTALTNQKTFFASFASKLASLESAVEALNRANAFEGRSASVSDTTAAAVSIGGTTPRGTYTVTTTSLARAQVTTTTSSHADTDTTVVASGGSLTIGGVTVSLTGDVTLRGLADAINGAGAPATASIVQNGANYQLVLTGTETGAAESFTITNGLTGGSGVAFSATNAQNASNAVGTVNGVAFSSPSNSIQGVIPEGTLTLYKEAPVTNPVSITITGDRNSVKELVRKVRAAYNEVVGFIDDQQQASAEKNASSIGRDPLVRNLRSQLAQVLNLERPAGGTFTAISQVGLSFSRTGQLEFNEAEFDDALDRDFDSVVRLFQGNGGADEGAFQALQGTIETYTSAGGLIPTAQERIDEQVLKITARIDDMELRLERRREALQKEFTAADLAMKQLNNSAGQLGSLGSVYSSF